MSTGVESFADINTLGAIYPMQGSEILLTVICIVYFVACKIWRIVTEKQEHEEIVKCAREKAQK